MKHSHLEFHHLPTKKELFRSTIIALVASIVILVTIILPAEYAIDPTRIGSLLGLTRMGEIKMQLAEEAREAEKKQVDLDESLSNNIVVMEDAEESAPVNGEQKEEGIKKDTVVKTIARDQAIEIKVSMSKGATIKYSWSVDGGALNYNTHGEPYDKSSSYSYEYNKGMRETKKIGTITAKFDGTHGWYWRNRSNGKVTLTLGVEGDYISVAEMR